MNVFRAALLADYDAKTYPWQETGNPVHVGFNLVFHKILGVDLYSGTMSLAVWYQVSWNDPRLVWDPEQWGGVKYLCEWRARTLHARPPARPP